MGACLIALVLCPSAHAQGTPDKPPRPVSASSRPGDKPGFNLLDGARDAAKPENISTTLEIVIALTVLSLAPALLVMVTSFTRIVIVLSFVRRAIGAQELPPNQVITGLSLFLTFMVMTPTLTSIKRDALDPYTSPSPSRSRAPRATCANSCSARPGSRTCGSSWTSRNNPARRTGRSGCRTTCRPRSSSPPS